jgi:hypothetical protein
VVQHHNHDSESHESARATLDTPSTAWLIEVVGNHC